MNQDMAVSASSPSRLERLLQYLEADPANPALLVDAAEAALEERRPQVAAELLARRAAVEPLSPEAENLAGLAAIEMRDYPAAAAHFERLMEAGGSDPALRFNLAWARAMLKDFAGAAALLDGETARALPQAAMLEVQLLHEQGEFDAAAERARAYIEIHPDHPGLMAAVSVLALDVEDPRLAADCAAKAGDHPDALATLGTLALGEDRGEEALALFDRALARNEGVPRAWVGRGLARLLRDDPAEAAADIDRGAEMFGDHLGSWIAAGWAWFVKGDLATARARFETALAIDPTFAETHGSLAVLDIAEGETERGRERSEVALRLDRNCYSAALARVLLASAAGDEAGARRIFEIAANTPVDGEGRTIAQALARMGLSS